MTQDIVVQPRALARSDELTVDELAAQVQKVQQAVAAVMKDGEHFGIIPGTAKPTLLKPGAEKLCLLFRLDPEYEERERWLDHGHYQVTIRCTLHHIPTGNRVASGLGSCSTKEAKYAYRKSERVCPKCGAAAIIKGKAEYGGGWLCWKNHKTTPGCGAKFRDGDPAVEGQQTGRIDNPDLADTYNTVLKMAAKRALVAAVLNGTAASDLFTQDLEDTQVPAGEPMGQETVSADAGSRAPVADTAERASSAAQNQQAESAQVPPVADSAPAGPTDAPNRSRFQPPARVDCQHPPDSIDVAEDDRYHCDLCGATMLSRGQMAKIHAVVRELDGHADTDAAPIPEPWTDDAESWVQVLKAQLVAAGVESRKQLSGAQAHDLIEWLEAQRLPF